MRYFSEDQVRQLAAPDAVIHALREAFTRDYAITLRMPARTQLALGGGGVLLLMPAYDTALQAAGIKTVTVTPQSGVLAAYQLLDPASGEYNLPFVRRRFGDRAAVVTFAVWQAGYIVAAGNPHALREAGDLARPSLRLVNREAGTGARALLDSQLVRAGLTPEQVRGYGGAVGSHLAVAEAVAAGLADVGIGVRAAAQALGLEFLPLAEERYDLVIPRTFLDLPAVQALLGTLQSPLFKLEVEALGGYDVSRMGDVLTAA